MFKLSDIEKKKPGDPSEVKTQKFLKTHLVKTESLKHLVGKFPSPEEIYFLWTLKSFNAFTFLTYVIKHSGIISNLILSTYSINMRIVKSLVRYFDKGDIENIHLIVSDSIKHRMPKVVELLKSLENRTDNVKIDYAWNHSKITLMQSKDNYYVVEGSGNFSENAQHEQYIFLNNKNIYGFREKNIRDSIRS